MKPKNHVLIAALATVTLVVVLTDAAQVAAQTVKTQLVKVANTTNEPVPIVAQGTTTVAGTVGINGTPDVRIANMPTVTLAPGSSIVVNNDALNAIPIRDVDNPARQPFQVSFSDIVPAQASGISRTFSVPAGKRLVIEFVSVSVFGQKGGMLFQVASTANSQVGRHVFVLAPVNDTVSDFLCAGNFETKIYADAGEIVEMSTNRVVGESSPQLVIQENISGYFIDLP